MTSTCQGIFHFTALRSSWQSSVIPSVREESLSVIPNPPQAVWGIFCFCSFSRRFFILLTLRSEWQPCHSEPRPMVECEESPLSIFLAIVAIALSLYRRFFGALHLRKTVMPSRSRKHLSYTYCIDACSRKSKYFSGLIGQYFFAVTKLLYFFI